MLHSTRQLIHSELWVLSGPSCAPWQHTRTHCNAWARSVRADWMQLCYTVFYFSLCVLSEVPMDPNLLVEADTGTFCLYKKAFCASLICLVQKIKPTNKQTAQSKPEKNKPSLPRLFSRELYFENIHVMCQIFLCGWHFVLVLFLEPIGCSWWL